MAELGRPRKDVGRKLIPPLVQTCLNRLRRQLAGIRPLLLLSVRKLKEVVQEEEGTAKPRHDPSVVGELVAGCYRVVGVVAFCCAGSASAKNYFRIRCVSGRQQVCRKK